MLRHLQDDDTAVREDNEVVWTVKRIPLQGAHSCTGTTGGHSNGQPLNYSFYVATVYNACKPDVLHSK